MSETQTGRVCRFPGCERPAQSGESGAGRPPQYCSDPEHTRASAWRARQRTAEAPPPAAVPDGVAGEDGRPVDTARARAGAISAQVTGMSEHLLTQLTALLTELRTMGDPATVQVQIEAVTSEAAEQVAAAQARAVRGEQAQREAIAAREEADAAASEATTRAQELDSALSQVRDDLAHVQQASEQLRAERDDLTHDLAQQHARTEAVEGELAHLTAELTAARHDHAAARAQADTEQQARGQAEQRAAADCQRADSEGARAAAAEEATAGVREQLEAARAEIEAAREHTAALREQVAALSAQRDAAQADVQRERAHGDQRVADLHGTYARPAQRTPPHPHRTDPAASPDQEGPHPPELTPPPKGFVDG